MNTDVIPDLLAIGSLVVVFVLLFGRAREVHLRYWVGGWILIVIHFAADLPQFQNPLFAQAAVTIALSALLLSSVAFVWGSRALNVNHAPYPPMGLLSAAPGVTFCAALVLGAESIALYAVLTIISAVWVAAIHFRSRAGFSRIATCAGMASVLVFHALQLYFVLNGWLILALNWLLCWHFLATAIEFRMAGRPSVGVIFTTVSFVAWAIVFPVSWLLRTRFPEIHVGDYVWNLPKYLVATGFLVTLLQEQRFNFEQASLHDDLTRVPNRRMLLTALEEATTTRSFTLMILDLDLFKEINDRVGHVVGDHLLRLVADRLRHVVRHNDILARVGGDEFAILLPAMNDHDAATRVIDTVKAALREPFVIDSGEFRIGASIGYALAPEDSRDATTLYTLADQRMYAAKKDGRIDLRHRESAAQQPVTLTTP